MVSSPHLYRLHDERVATFQHSQVALTADDVLRKIVINRIDAVIERIQEYVHHLSGFDPPYEGPYSSLKQALDDARLVFLQAYRIGIERNDQRRLELGGWIISLRTQIRNGYALPAWQDPVSHLTE